MPKPRFRLYQGNLDNEQSPSLLEQGDALMVKDIKPVDGGCAPLISNCLIRCIAHYTLLRKVVRGKHDKWMYISIYCLLRALPRDPAQAAARNLLHIISRNDVASSQLLTKLSAFGCLPPFGGFVGGLHPHTPSIEKAGLSASHDG